MPIMHLVEVEVATNTIVGEWRNNTLAVPMPVAAPGRIFVDVTNLGIADLGSISFNYEYDNGVLTQKAARKPVLSSRQFVRLFTKAEVLAIKAAALTDPDVDYAWMLLTINPSVDLNIGDIASDLQSLVAKGLLTPGRATAIGNGQGGPP